MSHVPQASRRFVKADYIVEYAGDLLSESDALLREAEYQADPTKGSYMYFFEYKGKQYWQVWKQTMYFKS